jgi:hypothetical protein
MSGSQHVADLIMQLMSKGNRGGLPMQASPELEAYLAQAGRSSQAGPATGPNLVAGPGSGFSPDQLGTPMTPSAAHSELSAPEFLSDPRLPTTAFRQEGAGNFTAGEELYIWIKNPKTGQRVRLDGPFSNDIEAARELRMLREAGQQSGFANIELEIGPNFDNF